MVSVSKPLLQQRTLSWLLLPADVEREDVLWQQLVSHGRVKHWGDSSYGYGGVGHAQDPIEPRHSKRDARLLHCFSKLLAGNREACNLQRGETERKTSL